MPWWLVQTALALSRFFPAPRMPGPEPAHCYDVLDERSTPPCWLRGRASTARPRETLVRIDRPV